MTDTPIQLQHVHQLRAAAQWRRGMVGVGILAALLLTIAVGAQATQPITLDIVVEATAGADADTVDLGSMTYQQAVDSLSADGRTRAVLPIAPAGTPSLGATDAQIHLGGDPATPSLVAIGQTTVLGRPAGLLVTAVWTSGTDSSPMVAVVMDTGVVGLGDLTDFTAFPMGLSHSLLAVSRQSHQINPAALPAVAAPFFDDATGADPTLTVTDAGVAFRGTIDATNTVLGDVAGALGLTGQVRLDGLLSGSAGSLGSAAPDALGLDLTATLPVSGVGLLPDAITTGAPWTLHLLADGGGQVSLSLGGAVGVSLGDANDLDVAASVSIGYAGGTPTIDLTGDVGRIDDLLGEPWLDLAGVRLQASLTGGTFSGGLAAVFDLQDLTGSPRTGEVALGFEVGSGGAAGTLDVTTDANVTVGRLVNRLGSQAVPSEVLDINLDGFGLSVGFDTRGGTSATVAVTSTVALTVQQATFSSDVLVRAGLGSESSFLLALRPDVNAPEVRLSQLVGQSLPSDITLPDFTVSFATSSLAIPAADLDAATARYLGDGVDLDVASGVALGADVVLPDDLRAAIDEVGLSADGPIRLVGRIPIFGGSAVDLAVEFPEIVGAEGTPFRSGSIALQIKAGTSGMEFTLAGTVVVGAPRTEDPGCAEPYAGSCTDLLTFGVDATMSFDTSGTVSFSLEGALREANGGGVAGWHEPFGVKGLSIFGIALKVGVEVSPDGPKLTIGMLGQLKIGDIDLTAAFSLALTPDPPWIEPLGFTFASESGFGLHSLTTLAEVLTQTDLPDELDIPPTIRLENVFIAFGRVNDSDLCLRQGFYLSADLHIGGTPRTDTTPGCEPPPTSPPEATERCAAAPSCLASVLIDVDDGRSSGTPGIRAAGFMRQLDIGPIHFEPTILQLELSPQAQRLYLAGGASIDDLRNPGGEPWAQARVRLDLTTTKLRADVRAQVRDGQYLSLRMRGEADFDLQNPRFIFDVDMKTNILGAIAAEISPEVEEVVAAIEEFANILDPTDVNIFRNLHTVLQRRGNVEQWVLDLVNVLAVVEEAVHTINDFVPGPGPIYVTEIRDLVLKGIHFNFPGTPAVDNGNYQLFPDGCVNVQGRHADGRCYGIPPWSIDIPGVCDIPGFANATGPEIHYVLCTARSLNNEELVEETFERTVLDRSAVTIPTNVTNRQLLTQVGQQLDGADVVATCGDATLDYGTGTISEAELTLRAAGNPMVIGVDMDHLFTGADPTANRDLIATGQGVSEVIAEVTGNGDVSQGRCDVNSMTEPETGLDEDYATMVFYDDDGYARAFDEADEGEAIPVAIWCNIPGPYAELSWGDGSPVQFLDMREGEDIGATSPTSRLVHRTWYDDTGNGSSNTLRPTIRCGPSLDVGQVTITNVDPVLTDVTVSADQVQEGDTVDIDVTFIDPGADAHEVYVHLPDGSVEVINVPAPEVFAEDGTITPPGERTVTVSHVVADDDPSGQDGGSYAVSIRVLDDDGGRSAMETVVVDVVNVAPTATGFAPVGRLDGQTILDDDGDPIAGEGQEVVWRLDVADPGIVDEITAVIDWGDGTQSTVDLPVQLDPSAIRTAMVPHRYADEDPSGTPSDDREVVVTLTDDDTGTTTTTLAAEVHNIAPSITAVSVTPTPVAENGAEVTVDVAFTDPAGLDSHTVVVDWGEGWTDIPVGADATGTDARRSLIDVPAIADGQTERTTQATNRYGDDGEYVITVTVTDDDTGVAVGSEVVTVDNTAPSQSINALAEGAIPTPGGTTFVRRTDQSLTVSTTAQDPGSDDLTFTWDHGDGSGRTGQSLVEVPGPGDDDDPSPQVAPRLGVTDPTTHAYADPCLYGITVDVTDDDGGTSDVEVAAVVVQDHVDPDDKKKDRKYSHWRSDIRHGDFDQAQVACMVDVAGHMSSVLLGRSEVSGAVFSPAAGLVDATVVDEDGVPILFSGKAEGSKLDKARWDLDKRLLAVWMNYALGRFDLDTVVDKADATVGEILASVEQVRLDSLDEKELKDARKLLDEIRKRK